MSPKDKIEKLDRAGVVYKINCSDCPSTYVGESERILQDRYKKHQKGKTVVAAHLAENKHSFSEAEGDESGVG